VFPGIREGWELMKPLIFSWCGAKNRLAGHFQGSPSQLVLQGSVATVQTPGPPFRLYSRQIQLLFYNLRKFLCSKEKFFSFKKKDTIFEGKGFYRNLYLIVISIRYIF
jgi:hypothetical protein